MVSFSLGFFSANGLSSGAQSRHRRIKASAGSGEISTTSTSRGQPISKGSRLDWTKLTQIGGAVRLVGGIATPIGATIWKLSGQLSTLATQAEALQKSMEQFGLELRSIDTALRQDIKNLDGRVTDLALRVARFEGIQSVKDSRDTRPVESPREASGPSSEAA